MPKEIKKAIEEMVRQSEQKTEEKAFMLGFKSAIDLAKLAKEAKPD